MLGLRRKAPQSDDEDSSTVGRTSGSRNWNMKILRLGFVFLRLRLLGPGPRITGFWARFLGLIDGKSSRQQGLQGLG